ncbi:hypothetical protein HPB48_018442 [Haemaphysalis longicornis]|uniref:Uncharacterized protein n=1 Tax=Haemaphysalis longicornis TaxID=44386 RepID=A0A9J6GAN7_HAELO|nr:hypothetical protein HPB48_018442 [Haemaphysalis longicornis]
MSGLEPALGVEPGRSPRSNSANGPLVLSSQRIPRLASCHMGSRASTGWRPGSGPCERGKPAKAKATFLAIVNQMQKIALSQTSTTGSSLALERTFKLHATRRKAAAAFFTRFTSQCDLLWYGGH